LDAQKERSEDSYQTNLSSTPITRLIMKLRDL